MPFCKTSPLPLSTIVERGTEEVRYNLTVDKEELASKNVVVLGLGLDTQDVIPYLEKLGAKLTILDEKRDGRPFGDLSKFDVIVRSPGVYRYRPEIVSAEKSGVIVTSKTKLFFDWSSTKNIIGVTGTKGKGTTTTLIYEILKSAGKDVYIGGNIGGGVFGFIDRLTPKSWTVLELSSFQLIDMTVSPHIAVVLMVTRDHLDWHADNLEYVAAKLPIASCQLPTDYVVANKDYPNSRKIGQAGKGRKIWVSRNDWNKPLRLRGGHNKENMAAAAAVAGILDINEKVVEKVAREFAGLEHRLEEVATIRGVTYFDDSFSTTPETTIAALEAFTEPMILIAGGSEKGSDFGPLGQAVVAKNNLRGVVLIGHMAERIRQAILAAGGKLNIVDGGKTMDSIVAAASALAKPGDAVVLSPAAASFDMFKNYKDRGNQFKAQVMLLAH